MRLVENQFGLLHKHISAFSSIILHMSTISHCPAQCCAIGHYKKCQLPESEGQKNKTQGVPSTSKSRGDMPPVHPRIYPMSISHRPAQYIATACANIDRKLRTLFAFHRKRFFHFRIENDALTVCWFSDTFFSVNFISSHVHHIALYSSSLISRAPDAS